MLRVLACVFLILGLVFALASNVDYKYLHDPSQIVSIQIVEVSETDSKGILLQTVISEIENKDEFLKDFEEIDCGYQLIGDPQRLSSGVIAIKFIYENGEYELISVEGMACYTEEKGFRNYNGYYNFDMDQLNELISKYTKSENAILNGGIGAGYNLFQE